MTTKTRLHKVRSGQQGSLLILALIIIFAMSAIGLTVAQTVFVQYGSMKQRLHVENATSAAEAGISATRQQLDANNSFAGWSSSNKQVLYNDTTRGKAEYSTEVTSNADGTKSIVSTGYVYRPGDTNPYNTKRIKAIVKSMTRTIQTPSIFAGPGGLTLAGGAIGPDSTDNVINVLGKLTMTNWSRIGASTTSGPSTGVPKVNVGNIACSSGSQYPVACPSNQEPISMGGYARIYGDVCAKDQVTQYMGSFNTEGIFPPGILRPQPCTPPINSMPIFDKKGFVDSMTSTATAGSGSCSGSTDSKTWPAKRTFTGNISASLYCKITVTGDVYITQSMTFGGFASIKVADGVTTMPTIVVNGLVDLGSTAIDSNNLGVGVRIISFHSNHSCSQLPDCTSIPAANAQASANIKAIDCQFCRPDASIFWSYFGQTYMGGPAGITFGTPLRGLGAVMGASVYLGMYGYYTTPHWMTSPPGTVTIPGSHVVLDYQQIF